MNEWHGRLHTVRMAERSAEERDAERASASIGQETLQEPHSERNRYAWMEGNKYKFLAPYRPADFIQHGSNDGNEAQVSGHSVPQHLDTASHTNDKCVDKGANFAPARSSSTQRLAVSRGHDPTVLLAKNIAAARRLAEGSTDWPLRQGSKSIAGLSVVQMLRAVTWYQGTIPGYAVYGLHILTGACDLASIVCTLPLFGLGIEGSCVKLGYLGPMMTLVFVMSLVDSGSLCAFIFLAAPRPIASGSRSFLDKAEASVGIWEWLLVCSVALQLSLMLSSWRIYRNLRYAGVYPPGNNALLDGEVRQVSILEVMCEAEDADMIANCDCHPDDCAPDGCRNRLADLVPVEDGTPVQAIALMVDDNCRPAGSEGVSDLAWSEEFHDVHLKGVVERGPKPLAADGFTEAPISVCGGRPPQLPAGSSRPVLFPGSMKDQSTQRGPVVHAPCDSLPSESTSGSHAQADDEDIVGEDLRKARSAAAEATAHAAVAAAQFAVARAVAAARVEHVPKEFSCAHL